MNHKVIVSNMKPFIVVVLFFFFYLYRMSVCRDLLFVCLFLRVGPYLTINKRTLEPFNHLPLVFFDKKVTLFMKKKHNNKQTSFMLSMLSKS